MGINEEQDQRLDALESAVRRLESADAGGVDTGEFGERLDALAETLNSLTARVSQIEGDRTSADLAQRLTQLEGRDAPDVGALTDRVSALETAAGERDREDGTETRTNPDFDPAALTARLEAIEGRVSELAGAVDTARGRINERTDTNATELQEIRKDVAALKAAITPASGIPGSTASLPSTSEL